MTESGEDRQSAQRLVRIDRELLWATLMELKEIGHLRATVGNLDVGEGQTNVIPHLSMITLDLRNPDDASMTAAEQHLANHVDRLAAGHGVEVAWERIAKAAVVPFHAGIQDVLADTAGALADQA